MSRATFWSELFDWFADFMATRGFSTRNFPKVESEDGEEPTAEFLREEARKTDAKLNSRPAKALTSTDKKALDKEFWESM